MYCALSRLELLRHSSELQLTTSGVTRDRGRHQNCSPKWTITVRMMATDLMFKIWTEILAQSE